MKTLVLIPILILLQASYFDMQGTIAGVNSPNSLLIDNKTVNLVKVDPSGLTRGQYSYLMNDLNDWLMGKDVFVKDEHVYFDLKGSYNSISINEMIQRRIKNLEEELSLYHYGPIIGIMGPMLSRAYFDN